MTTDHVTSFLALLTEWAAVQSGIKAVALVGSHARSAASPTSDIDLVILADNPEHFLAERTWVQTFGSPAAVRRENYGKLIAFDWSPTRQYDFVRTNLEYVPEPDWTPFVRRQYAAVAPGGRLILCHYRNPDEPVVNLGEVIERAGFTAAGRVDIPGTSIVWVEAF